MTVEEDPKATPSLPDYKPLPSSSSHEVNDAVLISSHPSSPSRRRFIISIFLISFASILIYIFWPSDPRIKIIRVKISHVHVHRRPVPSIDMTLLVTLKVSNADVYSFDFTDLDVTIDYRGKTLGHVSSDGGHVTAFGSSYLDAEAELDGVMVFPDVIHLIHDLAKGSVEFDTVTETNGKLGVLFFRFPLKAKVACGILVDTVNQTISRQSCSPL
ncbi:putative Late embryogenesis abundant protein, LEA_2 subgroup [Arabidopsis thaliana]